MKKNRLPAIVIYIYHTNENTYDFVVIGASISEFNFESFLNTRFSNAYILLVE